MSDLARAACLLAWIFVGSGCGCKADAPVEDDASVDPQCHTDEDCEDGDPCTMDTCDSDLGECVYGPVDQDGDGYEPIEVGGVECGGTDCDDSDDDVHPGADDSGCDWWDKDCDGVHDVMDDDGDSYEDEADCGGSDCDDTDPDIHPFALESCGGPDMDCDGFVDGVMPVRLDLLVSSTPRVSSRSSLAWSGSEYGVAWGDERDGDNSFYLARISASGERVGSDVRIDDPGGYPYNHTIVWAVSVYGVAWTDSRDDEAQVYFARFTGGGARVGPNVRMTDGPEDASSPLLAWSGSEYGLAWMDYRDGDPAIYFARISIEGVKVGSDVRISTDEFSSDASLAWSGSEFGAVWAATRENQLRFALIPADGTGARSETVISSIYDEFYSTSITWTGSEFGVAWESGTLLGCGAYLTRISANGEKIGSDTVIGDQHENPSIAWTGSEFGVALSPFRSRSVILFSRISPDGSEIESHVSVADAPYPHWGIRPPSIVWTGSEFGVGFGWNDRDEGTAEMYFDIIRYCP